jgi:phosphoglycerate dehydrogenase-like enzyme
MVRWWDVMTNPPFSSETGHPRADHAAGTSEHVVAVVEDSEPSVARLTPWAGVRYAFIEPEAPPPADAFQCEALFTWDPSNPFLRDNWSRLTNLRWVHTASAGVDRFLFPEMVASNVLLTNSRYVFDDALAEYVIGLMLVMSKDLGTTIALQREHRWVKRESDTLQGKVMVIVGVGPIARQVARFAKAFGMVVHGVGRTARGNDPDFGDVTATDTLPTLFAVADYVVMVLPKTAATTHLVDAKALAALKPSARLINVGRASTLDQDALVRALRDGRLAAAALDVVTPEPLPADDPLWDTPNLLISPHMSGDHHGWRSDIIKRFDTNLELWLRGEPLRNVIDKHLGYAPGD